MSDDVAMETAVVTVTVAGVTDASAVAYQDFFARFVLNFLGIFIIFWPTLKSSSWYDVLSTVVSATHVLWLNDMFYRKTYYIVN